MEGRPGLDWIVNALLFCFDLFCVRVMIPRCIGVEWNSVAFLLVNNLGYFNSLLYVYIMSFKMK
jgi:hypothetical protein